MIVNEAKNFSVSRLRVRTEPTVPMRAIDFAYAFAVKADAAVAALLTNEKNLNEMLLSAQGRYPTLPIEIKLAKARTLKQLEAALTVQLMGRYLRDESTRWGILLFVHCRLCAKGIERLSDRRALVVVRWPLACERGLGNFGFGQRAPQMRGCVIVSSVKILSLVRQRYPLTVQGAQVAILARRSLAKRKNPSPTIDCDGLPTVRQKEVRVAPPCCSLISIKNFGKNAMAFTLWSRNALLPLALALTGFSAQAQTDGPVESVLTSVESKTNNIVREAGSQGRGVVMEAAQGLLQAIKLFRSLYGEALTDTVQQLSGERAALFRDINNMAETLEASKATGLAGIQQATDSLAIAVAQSVGQRAFPRIRTIAPLFSVAGDAVPEFAIQGLFLAQGKPTLEMQGAAKSPTSATDAELRFNNPKIEATIAKPVLVPGTLTVYEHIARRFWFDAIEPKTYPVQLAVYPREIGPAVITPLVRRPQISENVIMGPPVRCESPRGDGVATVPHSFSATEGYAIDPASIEFVRDYANHGTHSFGSVGTLTLTCTGFGRNMLDAGQNGVISGRVRFRETKTTYVAEPGTPELFKLSWGDSKIVQLPSDAVGVKFALAPNFTGQRLESVGSSRLRFAIVEFDPAAKTVRISARPIDVALREP